LAVVSPSRSLSPYPLISLPFPHHSRRPLPSPALLRASTGKLIRLITVRNPYERILSAYLDKVLREKDSPLIPRGFPTSGPNRTFARFVHDVAAETHHGHVSSEL
jgi:predicted RNase H-like nuclease